MRNDNFSRQRGMVGPEHPKVNDIISEQSPNYDCRHFIKGIRSRIFKSAKGVKSRSLAIWQKSVVNMIWWSLGTSKGKGCPSKNL